MAFPSQSRAQIAKFIQIRAQQQLFSWASLRNPHAPHRQTGRKRDEGKVRQTGCRPCFNAPSDPAPFFEKNHSPVCKLGHLL